MKPTLTRPELLELIYASCGPIYLATRIAKKLERLGYVRVPRYGVVQLVRVIITEAGRERVRAACRGAR